LKNIRITIVFLLLLIVAFVALAGRCFYLQYYKSEHYYSISLKQQQLLISTRPQRGVILDSRARVLVASNKIQNIFAEPRVIKDPKAVSSKLQPILDIGAHEICKLITESKNPGFVKIKADAEPAQCKAVRKIHRGIGVQSDWQRHYPMGRLAANIVGFTSSDNRGLGGIELQYDRELSGSAGENIFLADAFPFRRPIRPEQQKSVLTDGVGIILTLDATIQQFARHELIKAVQNFEAESGVAIVAEPKTGAILAMVSLPDFDPDDVASADPNTFRNRAITDVFEPGSILKPIAAAIALDAGAVEPNETIFCENGNYHGKGFGKIKEYRYHRYGNLKVREILIKSSNIGMAKIGQRTGRDKLHRGLMLFGFGKKTGIELPGEAEGLLRPVQKWTGYSVTRIPFGQEISVTAIGLVRAFCILANGGHSVRPFLVKAIVQPDGKVVEIKRPTPAIGFVIKPQVAKWIVNDAMVGVVNEKKNGGTGWRAKLEKWQVFGKTGTAQLAGSDGKGYDDDSYVASFVAGAPAEQPAVVVLVSIRKPNKSLGKGYTGGAVASPAAGKILEKTLNYLEVPSFIGQL